MAMVGTRFKFFMEGIIHICHFFKYYLSLHLKIWVSQFIVKYKIKKSKKLNCHFENLDCRFPKMRESS
jgi:type II secretory pathway component PulF